MKRPIYHIKHDGKIVATKHAWNTARKEVRELVNDRLEYGEQARLFAFDGKRDELTREYISGVETWHTGDGRSFTFEIEKVQM